MESVQAKVQGAINTLITDIDKDHLRKMQASMYHCSAACCEKPHYNMDDTQRCVERCSGPITQAQQFIQTELGNFQDRLQRCAMDCQDKTRDKMGPNTTEAQAASYRGDMEKCVMKCADTHVALVPSMMKKMKEVLQKHQDMKLG
ncbi:hypothetical protein CAPTEDRAFT_220338 [Capitella teleta]|uniref:Protein FAM136A n=1 Tax=Capitella teleta TaxID=283909 RepID=R7U533_CAPTE|nr:hypothetical protein CAPTEDRAFT_220338 [Capitella teleta]|eukprot:ELT98265.1 hypothetical protein CAPTEDRAFT_220338 [Capitella teleta]